NRSAGDVRTDAEGSQHVGWLDASALTRGSARRGDAAQVERHQQRLAISAGNGNVDDVRSPRSSSAMNHGVRNLGQNTRLEAVAEPAKARAMCLAFFNSQLGRARQPDGGSDVLRARAASAILRAAVHQRLEMNAPPNEQRSDSLRRAELVAGDSKEIELLCLGVNRDFAKCLDG